MKIAVASDDGKTIAGHFGRTRGFAIFQVDNNQIVSEEYRINDFTGHARGLEGNHMADKHGPILTALSDCQVVCARGMGRRIYDDLANAQKEVFVVDENIAREAAMKYLAQSLQDHPDKSCEH